MTSDAAELAETLICSGLTGDHLRRALVELHGSTRREDWIGACVIARDHFEGELFGSDAELRATWADNDCLRRKLHERDAEITAVKAELATLKERVNG